MDAERLHERMAELGREKARTAAYFSTCDRLRKQIRAKWIVHHINQGQTVGKSENLAILEDEYIESCDVAEKAEEAAGIAAVEYEAAKAWMEVWRTKEATKRAEMSLR